ncbi:unnamed protein product [Blepharisma stoltei]|uniref:STI1/HOP DP domain-containing protein n=1 Tax=Blepharisma stoltei TaxID=1481888 RepID=A0AAU9J266_9CILI|nr:unnamed protein product [Blepharisma stoltei]
MNSISMSESGSENEIPRSPQGNSGNSNDDPLLSLFQGPSLAKLMTHPKTKEYFHQEDFVQYLNALNETKNTSLEFMSDPRFMECVGVLMGVDCSGPKNHTPQDQCQEDGNSDSHDEEYYNKQAAEEEKTLGNSAFGKKKWRVAMEHYDRAINLDPSEMTYINNKAACFFSIGEYQRCIELCDKALEIGKKNMADGKKIGRALSRKGHALEKLGRIDEAIDSLKLSLFEQNDDKVKFEVRDLERKKKKTVDDNYKNPGRAEENNLAANELFGEGDYEEAIKEYIECQKRLPNDINYLSNRAVCFIKLKQFYKALKDLDRILEIDHNHIQANIQKAFIHTVFKEYGKALECYEKVLQIDPDNQECKEGFKKVVRSLNFQIDCSDEDRMKRSLLDTSIKHILCDPQLIEFLEKVNLNKEQTTNPAILAAYAKLKEAGLLKATP